MKAYSVAVAYFLSLLTSTLNAIELSTSCQNCFTLGDRVLPRPHTHCQVSPGGCLDILEKRKIPCLCHGFLQHLIANVSKL
jgi:hypothetical protein